MPLIVRAKIVAGMNFHGFIDRRPSWPVGLRKDNQTKNNAATSICFVSLSHGVGFRPQQAAIDK